MTLFKQYDCLADDRAILRLACTYRGIFYDMKNEKDKDFNVLCI